MNTYIVNVTFATVQSAVIAVYDSHGTLKQMT